MDIISHRIQWCYPNMPTSTLSIATIGRDQHWGTALGSRVNHPSDLTSRGGAQKQHSCGGKWWHGRLLRTYEFLPDATELLICIIFGRQVTQKSNERRIWFVFPPTPFFCCGASNRCQLPSLVTIVRLMPFSVLEVDWIIRFNIIFIVICHRIGMVQDCLSTCNTSRLLFCACRAINFPKFVSHVWVDGCHEVSKTRTGGSFKGVLWGCMVCRFVFGDVVSGCFLRPGQHFYPHKVKICRWVILWGTLW